MTSGPIGGIGTSHAMEIVNNALSAACLTATAEAIVVGMRAGIDPRRAVEIIAVSPEKLAEEVSDESRVTGEAIRWFREAMAGTLASGDHVEVVKLIGYSEGGRS